MEWLAVSLLLFATVNLSAGQLVNECAFLTETDPVAACNANANAKDCGNLADCIDTANSRYKCTDKAEGYSCSCNTDNGYENYGLNKGDNEHGLDCVTPKEECAFIDDIPECESQGGLQCEKLASCRPPHHACSEGTNHGYTCECATGFEDVGPKVNTDWNLGCVDKVDCSSSLCTGTGQLCRETPGNYECYCDKGYKWETDDKTNCIQIDECAEGEHSCGTYAECEDKDPEDTDDGVRYVCTCPADGNFIENADATCCEDVDECAMGEVLCGPNSHCVNTIGAYVCECDTGYAAEDDEVTTTTTCLNIDECELNTHTCGPNSRCVDTVGNFICNCNPGYMSQGPDVAAGRNCINLNECAPGIPNKCREDEECVDTDGSYECKCGDGFQYNSFKGRCEDIDECKLAVYPCERDEEIRELMHEYYHKDTCENTMGAYKCICPRHYKMAEDDKECIPINHCADGSHECSDISECVYDGPDKYRCNCKLDHWLPGNELEMPCKNRNECESADENNCDMVNGGCKDTEGSYQCYCKDGFKDENADDESEDPSCADIDECDLCIDECDHRNGGCMNTEGGYKCTCNEGFQEMTGVQVHRCEDRNECDVLGNRACDAHAECCNTHGSYECRCPTGFYGNGYPVDKTFPKTGTGCTDYDECQSEPCDERAECHNTPGSYKCTCKHGFIYNPFTKYCDDVNECVLKETCGVHQCQNTPGSYTCTCNDGYEKIDGQCKKLGHWTEWMIKNRCQIEVCGADLALYEKKCVEGHCTVPVENQDRDCSIDCDKGNKIEKYGCFSVFFATSETMDDVFKLPMYDLNNEQLEKVKEMYSELSHMKPVEFLCDKGKHDRDEMMDTVEEMQETFKNNEQDIEQVIENHKRLIHCQPHFEFTGDDGETTNIRSVLFLRLKHLMAKHAERKMMLEAVYKKLKHLRNVHVICSRNRLRNPYREYIANGYIKDHDADYKTRIYSKMTGFEWRQRHHGGERSAMNKDDMSDGYGAKS